MLQQAYQQRNFMPLWFQQGKISQPALDLLALLRNAASYGLHATDYDGIALTSRLTQLSDGEPVAQAQLEVGLSTAVLRFIKHLHYGRIDPRKVGFNIDVASRNLACASAALAATDVALLSAKDVNAASTLIPPAGCSPSPTLTASSQLPPSSKVRIASWPPT